MCLFSQKEIWNGFISAITGGPLIIFFIKVKSAPMNSFILQTVEDGELHLVGAFEL